MIIILAVIETEPEPLIYSYYQCHAQFYYALKNNIGNAAGTAGLGSFIIIILLLIIIILIIVIVIIIIISMRNNTPYIDLCRCIAIQSNISQETKKEKTLLCY